MTEIETVNETLRALTEPNLQNAFADWVRMKISPRDRNFPNMPPAPRLPRFFEDGFWSEGEFWRSPKSGTSLPVHKPWALVEVAWQKAMIPVAFANPQVLQALITCGVEWQHTHALWNPPPDGIGTIAPQIWQDFGRDQRYEITPLPVAFAFVAFAQWCANQTPRAEEKRDWMAWANLTRDLLVEGSLLWENASGLDMVCLHSFSIIAKEQDIAPVLTLLEVKFDSPQWPRNWQGLIPIATHLTPYGVRQRLLQEMAARCQLHKTNRGYSIDLEAIAQVGKALQVLHTYLQRYAGQPAPDNDDQCCVALFIFNLLDFMLEGFSPRWFFRQASNPLLELLDNCRSPQFKDKLRNSLKPIIDLVRLEGNQNNRLEELITLRPDFPPLASYMTTGEDLANGKAPRIIGVLKAVLTETDQTTVIYSEQ